MQKKELLEHLKATDGLSDEEKRYLVNLINSKKKYGLVWEDKPEAVEDQLRKQLPVLREVKERAIINDNEENKGKESKQDNPNHILIEGDNLHALTSLTFTHEGKVDLIYIDPPYNTGKENEFRFNDKWILKENPFKHSMWLNFMTKRLKMAKSLLADDGVFVCHIDENEFDALNLLLETEIFSEKDFLGLIVWNKLNPKGEVAGVATMHEYVLVYAKNKDNFKLLDNILSRPKPNAISILNKAKSLFNKLGKQQIPDSIKEVIKPFGYSKKLLKDFEVVYDLKLINKEFQSWLSKQNFSGGEKGYRFIDENGEVYQSVSMAAPDKPETRSHRPLNHPMTNKPCPVPSKGWRNPDITMDRLLEEDLIVFGEDEHTQPRKKYLLKENLSEVTPSIYNNGSSDEKLMKDLKLNFPYPKVTSVAQYLIKSIHPNPKLILDFFAGSGTTLHATMELNAEDHKDRKCILVTNNENDIAEKVTYKRNRKVIEGYTNSKGEEIPGLKRNNLRYYKTDFVSRETSLANKRKLTAMATELLCIKEDCYTEITSKLQKAPWHKLFSNTQGRYVYIVYDDLEIETAVSLLEGFIEQNPEASITVYVFSNGPYAYAEEFESVATNIDLAALPDAIYKAFQNILPKQNRDFVPELDEDSPNETADQTELNL